MSSEGRVTPVTVVYPFGLLSLSFALISMFATTFFSHPENDPTVVTITSYLRTLGFMGFILIFGVLIYTKEVDRRSIMDKQYNPVGMWLAFLLGLGGLAVLKTIGPNANPFSALSIQFSSLQIDMEVFMFMVATIEELMFRVGVAMAVYRFYPSRSSFVKLGVATGVSSVMFAMWHYFAYQGNIPMMIVSAIAGVFLTAGYLLGAKYGAGDLSFIGIVAGHWLWNISLSGGFEPILLVGAMLTVVTLLVLLTNRYAMYLLISLVKRVVGGR